MATEPTRSKGGYLAPLIDGHRPSCETCMGGFFPNKDGPAGHCRAQCPTGAHLFAQPKLQGGELESIVRGYWPIVYRENWCLQWRIRKEALT